ncbi:MAG: cation:proton antiporter [Mucinivorans sp.]
MIPPLIIDLALILGLAALTTILFRWMKQPVVLGYILAGYLASSQFELLPTVQDEADIKILAELGIIFLLFGLGLEFSFKKLLKVGGSALITALVIVLGMMMLGYSTGQVMGWSTTDSVFLGGMLSMSSTTIIIKAFNDLGLRSHKFTTVVFGVLVVEDLFAVILMVVLSTLYLGQKVEGIEMVWSLIKLIFFLIVWFGAGLYLVPLLLKKARQWLTGETLLILSLGLCLGMVVLAGYVGFSSALGAFIMGSILAETVEAKSIEKLTTPVRDLFGAVFFVSVGMLVEPEVLMEYWLPILVIVAIVIVGQICFATLGMLLSGQPLKIAIQSGFSLAQIGEFAFIIATLGLSLGVTSEFLYPVAVAVSVITTFATPFIMRLSTPAYLFVEAHLPKSFRRLLKMMSSTNGEMVPQNRGDWRVLIVDYLKNLLLFSTLLVGVVWLLQLYLIPFVTSHLAGFAGQFTATLLSILVVAPFIWGITLRRIAPNTLLRLWAKRHINRGFIISLVVLRFLVAFVFVVVLLGGIYSQWMAALVGLALTSLVLALFQSRIKHLWSHFEKQLRVNMSSTNLVQDIDERNQFYHIAHIELTTESLFAGRTIDELSLRQMYGVTVVSVQRGSRTIVAPGASELLMPTDVLSVVGSDESLRAFQKFAQESSPAVEQPQMVIRQLWLRADSPLVGQSVMSSPIRSLYHSLVVGIERADGSALEVNPRTIFCAGDVVWLAGESSSVEQIVERL